MTFDERSPADDSDSAVAHPVRHHPNRGVVLVCYDGSDGARRALEAALDAFDRPMLVACYWQAFAKSSKGLRVELLEAVQDRESVNARELAEAQRIADDGVSVVTVAGGQAEGIAVELTGPVSEAIVDHAARLGAVAIVMGGEIRAGLRSVLTGDITGDVVRTAEQPVFLVSDHSHSGSSKRRVHHGWLRLRPHHTSGTPKLIKMTATTNKLSLP